MLDFLFGPWFTQGGYLILVAGAVASLIGGIVVGIFSSIRSHNEIS